MAEQLYRVELTASFLERLESIEAFLVEADAGFAFDDLLAEIRATVIPNLRRFPRMGRRYLVNPPQSAEALALLAAMPAGAPDALREYAPVLQESGERRPAPQAVIDGFGRGRAFWDLHSVFVQPGVQFVDDRLALLLA